MGKKTIKDTEWVKEQISNGDVAKIDGVERLLLGIGGDGYSWVDETDNRDSDTTYTNDNGKPIMILIHGTGVEFKIEIDGNEISYFETNTDSANGIGISFIVPDGVTYKYKNLNGSINNFYELK